MKEYIKPDTLVFSIEMNLILATSDMSIYDTQISTGQIRSKANFYIDDEEALEYDW